MQISSPTDELGLINIGVKSMGDVKALRRACDEVTELCHGNESKGIKGWRDCWKSVHDAIGK